MVSLWFSMQKFKINSGSKTSNQIVFINDDDSVSWRIKLWQAYEKCSIVSQSHPTKIAIWPQFQISGWHIYFQYTGDHEIICIASNIMKEVFCYCWRSYVRVKETSSGRIIWIPQHNTGVLWRSFNAFFLSIWKQLDGNQRILLFVHDDRDRYLKIIK